MAEILAIPAFGLGRQQSQLNQNDMTTNAEQQVQLTSLKHVLAFPRVQSMITGVIMAEWAEDKATLIYTDGTRESCACSVVEFHEWGNRNSGFGIVTEVQQRARSTR